MRARNRATRNRLRAVGSLAAKKSGGPDNQQTGPPHADPNHCNQPITLGPHGNPTTVPPRALSPDHRPDGRRTPSKIAISMPTRSDVVHMRQPSRRRQNPSNQFNHNAIQKMKRLARTKWPSPEFRQHRGWQGDVEFTAHPALLVHRSRRRRARNAQRAPPDDAREFARGRWCGEQLTPAGAIWVRRPPFPKADRSAVPLRCSNPPRLE